MKLERLKIEGFRKIKQADIDFGDATFLVGYNNVGKSSIFEAVRLIVTNNSATKDDFTMVYNQSTNQNETVAQSISLEATFSNLPKDANTWLGFRGRIFTEDGKQKIRYKKVFGRDGTVKYWMYEQSKELNPIYLDGTKINKKSMLAGGLGNELIEANFPGIDPVQNLAVKAHQNLLDNFGDVWQYKDEVSWVENPGGIPQNVISKMPKLIVIPAEHKSSEMDASRNSALGEVMTTIFGDILEGSGNFEKVKEFYTELAKEVDTEEQGTEFSKLMVEVNQTIKGVFPEAQLYAKVNLNDPNTFLKPTYDIRLGSNIMTGISYQGTGMIRSTAFSLLKYREEWRKKREKDLRNIIICFEEPELFLHPNAANLMRETIYELASDVNQIICTSHSPYMIDLSREKERQVINLLSVEDGFVSVLAFNITDEYRKLVSDDKTYIKMLLKIDDSLARVFFAKRVVIIEGDTEEAVLRRTIDLVEKPKRLRILSETQIAKARGKATIISLVRYLKALGINDLYVLHDRDAGKTGAEKFNLPILEANGSNLARVVALEECIEDALGYAPPEYEKPYTAFRLADTWQTYEEVPKVWKAAFEKIYAGYL